MGKGSKAQKQTVTDYLMSVFYGFCHGPVDEIRSIKIGKKEAWSGQARSEMAITINQPNLFGGAKKEGGAVGTAWYLPGGSDQVLHEIMAARTGRTSATSPGYRGLMSVFFLGGGGRGFQWSSNNPYLPEIAVTPRRKPVGLSPGLRMVGGDDYVRTEIVNLDGVSNSANTIPDRLTKGVTVSGFLPTDVITFTLPANQRYISWRFNEGNYFAAFGVVKNGNPTDGNTFAAGFVYVTAEESRVAFNARIAGNPIGFSFTGASSYTFYLPGLPLLPATDKRSGLSIQIVATPGVIAQDTGPDANPAAIIYEALTNGEWGMGASPAIIDVASFEAAATTLRAESFGLSMVWTKQSTIEDFVSEVIDHIQATLFVNPSTGLITIKLIRGDYSVVSLPVLNPDNCKVTSFDRKAWGETTNEIVVTWTNPENEQEETVTAQDLANIVIQGTVISDSRNYYGVRNADLAMRLAKRDLRTASAPLATVELEVNRSAWNFVPGGCCVLDYPEYGISGLVLRIGKIDYGKPGEPTIKVNAIEDIFGLPIASYTTPPGSSWVDPATDPSAVEKSWVITTPAFLASSIVANGQATTLEYPDVLTSILATTANADATGYDLVAPVVEANGETNAQVIGAKSLLGSALLPSGLTAEATTTLSSFGTITGGAGPVVGGFIFIGETTQAYQEIAVINSLVNGTYELKRGVLDTVPRAWPAGTRVWFVSKESNITDTTVRGEGETVRYKLLAQTSKGRLDQFQAPVTGAVLIARPYLPNRPANVTVGGVAVGGKLDVSASPPSTISVSWANRNRTMEDSVVVDWTAASVTPETGQTTTITLYDPDTGSVITTINGLTGTSYALPVSSFGTYTTADVKVTSKRDGFESLQGATVRVKVSTLGWGDTWGDDWGGGDALAIPDLSAAPAGGGIDPTPSTAFPVLF